MGGGEKGVGARDMEAMGVLDVAEPYGLCVRGSVSMEIWGKKAWGASEESDGYGGRWAPVARSYGWRGIASTASASSAETSILGRVTGMKLRFREILESSNISSHWHFDVDGYIVTGTFDMRH